MNLLRRKLSVTNIPKHYTKREVFFIVWHKDKAPEYFLTNSKNDGSDLYWSVFEDQGIKFEKGEDALAFCNEINETKRPGIIELKIISEQVLDEDQDMWSI